MRGSDVGLQQGICRECHSHVGRCVRALLCRLGAFCAGEALLRVDPALVRSKVTRRVEGHGTFFARIWVDMGTRKWLLFQMRGHDVLL